MSRRRRILLFATGLAVGSISLILAGRNPYQRPRQWLLLELPVLVAVGWSFILVGTLASSRRPENRVGRLMSVVGFTWFAGFIGFIPTPLTFTVGGVLENFSYAPLAHLCIVFPYGRARSLFERRAIILAYAWIVFGSLGSTLIHQPGVAGCKLCPRLMFIPGTEGLGHPLALALPVGDALVALLVLGIVVQHWRRASPRARRALAPVAWSVIPLVAVLFVGQVPAVNLGNVLRPMDSVATAIIPVGFLVGLLRTRLGRAAVGDLVLELAKGLSGEGARRALATALADPSLELLFALPGDRGFVDPEGHARTLPSEGSGRAVTMIEGPGGRIAALVHDPALNDDPGLVAAAGTAARLALENARLHADLKAQLEEVRFSRMRIVRTGDAERRRVERNLHDGAQQRLVGLSLALGMARRRAQGGMDPELVATIDRAAGELSLALDELRELARGVHPAVLSRSGLKPALRSLAERSTVPVDIVAVPAERFSEAVEATVYFVVSEALANAAKYARATQVTVSASAEHGSLRVEVADDGVGGADAGQGSGLSGLADRLAALGGVLDVRSPPGRGTCVVAEIPCA